MLFYKKKTRNVETCNHFKNSPLQNNVCVYLSQVCIVKTLINKLINFMLEKCPHVTLYNLVYIIVNKYHLS